MIYSIYNYGSRTYDYYQAPAKSATHAPVPPRANDQTAMGATADDAAWPLPLGARKVGSGPNAKGRIAKRGGGGMGLGGGFFDYNVTDVAVAAVAIWLMLRKGSKS